MEILINAEVEERRGVGLSACCGQPNKGMNRTRNKRSSNRELESIGGLGAPVIPGVMGLTHRWKS